MAFYSKKKNKCWVWLAWDREGKRCCGVELGRRNAVTGKRLWQQLNLFEESVVCTDHFPAYETFVPEHQHVATKAETWGIESLNSRIRHFLARFRRKTFRYSKALHRVKATLILFLTPDCEQHLC